MDFRLIALLLFCFVFHSVGAEGIVVIAHPSVGLNSISRSFARALFGMRMPQWPEDGRATVFVLPDNHALHEAFSKQVLDVFPHQLRSAWDRQTFSGTGPAPIEVGSAQEMLTRIAATPGSVGYLYKEMADEKKVRRLEVH